MSTEVKQECRTKTVPVYLDKNIFRKIKRTFRSMESEVLVSSAKENLHSSFHFCPVKYCKSPAGQFGFYCSPNVSTKHLPFRRQDTSKFTD